MSTLPDIHMPTLLRKAARKLGRSPRPKGFDMRAVKLNLTALKHALPPIYRKLHIVDRPSLTPNEVNNLLDAYRHLSALLASGKSLTKEDALGLNLRCLLGNRFREFKSLYLPAALHFAKRYGTMWHYYKWYSMSSPWRRAAKTYSAITGGIPQPFIDGNTRTGVLLICHILASAGEPPFFLTPQNAEQFLSISLNIMKHSRLIFILRDSYDNGMKKLERDEAALEAFLKKNSCSGFEVT